MVQVETSQLTAECNAWRDALRQYREEFTRDKIKLQEVASQSLSKEQLHDVEHLQNQFHIQLINIHDVKHSIKSHIRKIESEFNQHNGQIREETFAEHENLYAQYQGLDTMLLELREEFDRFLSTTS